MIEPIIALYFLLLCCCSIVAVAQGSSKLAHNDIAAAAHDAVEFHNMYLGTPVSVSTSSLRSLHLHHLHPPVPSSDGGNRRLSSKHKLTEADKYSNSTWAEMSKESFDPKRGAVVKDVLTQVAGVYVDKKKSKELGIEKYVLVNVLALNLRSKDGQSSKYLHLMQNWYCFAAHHGLQPVTYIVPAYEKDYEDQVKDFHSLGINGLFLTYPTSLFWSLAAKKTTSVLGGQQRVSYAGSLPSFKHFGALTMLVPLLEVLELGYHAIYFDLDIVFVRDPIPHMIRGSADFVVSLEMKTCILPSVLEVAVHQHWHKTEPNTGILLLRATEKGISFFRTWLLKIVQENINNDQKVLYFDQFNSKYTFDCNANLDQYSDKPVFKHLTGFLPNRTAYHQHCFLNDFLFQNGKVGFQCALGQGGSQSDYVLGMLGQNFTDVNPNTGKVERSMTPVAIHGNYCDNKIDEFKNLGLWLAPDNADGFASNVSMSCKKYELGKTRFYTTDWEALIAKSKADIAEATGKFANNSMVRLFRKPTIYLVKDGVMYPFPNSDTIAAMGYDWKNINHMRQYNFIKFFPVGPEMPEMTLPPAKPPAKAS